MKKVIFVCTGNTCRSPMAEAILKHKLKENNIKNIVVSSAGLCADTSLKTNEKSIKALKILGIKFTPKFAKQLNKKMVTKNTVLITMTFEQKEYIKNLPNVFALKDFNSGIDLIDPYGQNEETYLNCAKILDFIINEILEKLVKGEL